MTSVPTPTVEVSVIVSTGRTSPYLAETLDSLRRQTFTSWELICVDDGSSDPARNAALVDQLPRSRFVSQQSLGLPAARNTGLRHCQAPLVTFLDDDDVWHPDRLARQVEALAADPGAVACYTAGWYMDSAGVPFGDGWPAEPTPSREMLRGAVPIPRIVTLMVRRPIVDDVGGFDERLSLAEDNDFILRVLCKGEFTAVSEQLVGYRRHEANMTNVRPLAPVQASSLMLSRQIASAALARERQRMHMLVENRRAFRRRASASLILEAAHAIRRGDLVDAAAISCWCARNAPLSAVSAFARALVSKLRRGMTVRLRSRL